VLSLAIGTVLPWLTSTSENWSPEAMAQKRRSREPRQGFFRSPAARMMSALPPKADMCGAIAHVCFGPKADIAATLFDHLVG
jgi:hypothetical protein